MGFWRRLFGGEADQPKHGRGGGSSAGRPKLPRARRVKGGRRRPLPEQPNLDLLTKLGLPPIRDGDHLAEVLQLPPGKLQWLTFPWDKQPVHYVERQIPKRSGGVRLIQAPKPLLRWVQRWILENMLERLTTAEPAHGFVKGRSIVTNAAGHAGKTVVVSADLEDFFPSVSIATVQGLFLWMGYSGPVARSLSLLCTSRCGKGRRTLPQGAPTSPALTNLVCWKLDRRLEGLARKFGATYTRYADDLTFSGDKELKNGLKRFLPTMRRVVADEGFRLNNRKFRFARKGRRQVVTGLVVNVRPNVPRETVRRLRATLHNCRVHGVESQNRLDDPLFLERLRGQVAFVSQINATQGARLKAALDQIPTA